LSANALAAFVKRPQAVGFKSALYFYYRAEGRFLSSAAAHHLLRKRAAARNDMAICFEKA